MIRHRPRGHSDYHHYHPQMAIITITRLADPAHPSYRIHGQRLREDRHTPATGDGTQATACCLGDP